MTVLSIALHPVAIKVILLGSGRLGKEATIERRCLGIETIAADHHPDAPAMQATHRTHVINMLHGENLCALIEQEKPDYIAPGIEATVTDTLAELEQAGQKVVPAAWAVEPTMNREGVCRLAVEELQLPTSSYRFADNEEGFRAVITDIGLSCIVESVMSPFGKGQSFIRSANQLSEAWRYAQQGGRAGTGRVIIEGAVNFGFEVTLLTVSTAGGVHFCAPTDHRQEDGDYREFWRPQQTSDLVLECVWATAHEVVLTLGSHGLFGVELFICGDEAIFSEVSPCSHDTGMITLILQDLSEFALHVRTFLGLPVGTVRQHGLAASAVILSQLISQDVNSGQL